MSTTIQLLLGPIWKRLLHTELDAPTLLRMLLADGGHDTEDFALPLIAGALDGTLADWGSLEWGLNEVMVHYAANIDDPEVATPGFIAAAIFVMLAASDARRAFYLQNSWEFTGAKMVLLLAAFPRSLNHDELRSIARYICKDIVDF